MTPEEYRILFGEDPPELRASPDQVGAGLGQAGIGEERNLVGAEMVLGG